MTEKTKQKEWYWGLCKHCGRGFLGVRSSKKYCNNHCKQEAYLKRRASVNITITVIQAESKPSLRKKVTHLLKKFASLPF